MNNSAKNISSKIFRSATFEGMADESGFPKKEYLELYSNLAKNGVKNIITGFAYVSRAGIAIHPGQAGIDSDEKIAHFRKVTDSTHLHNSKIFLQIAHSGRQTSSSVSKSEVVGASSKKSKYFRNDPKQLTINEINKIIESFADSALRAKTSGFNGIQLHAAHGYLIHQFLHPYINNRTDVFGINRQTGIGDLFLRKIISSVRKKCNSEFTIIVKISASDDLPKPFSKDNFVSLIKVLDEEKVDAIEISYGTMENALNIFRGDSIPVDVILKHNFRYKAENKLIRNFWKLFAVPVLKMKVRKFSEMYNLEYSIIAKKYTSIPIICVGGFRKGNEILKALEEGKTDFVSICRPLICEPDFIQKLIKNAEYVSKCVNCNVCAIMCDSGNSTRCYER